jgi:hypothetical protein
MHRILNLEHIILEKNISTNNVENTIIRLTTLNVVSKLVGMNYKMDNKEMLCTDAVLVTNTQISCNISAVAEVPGGSGSTNDKNNKNTTGTTTNEQRNCNDVERSAGLRPFDRLSSRSVTDAKPRLKQSKLLSDVTNCVFYARLATRRNVAQHCETQRTKCHALIYVNKNTEKTKFGPSVNIQICNIWN